MKILWDERAWEEYLKWQTKDKQTLNRIVYKEKNREIIIESCRGHYED